MRRLAPILAAVIVGACTGTGGSSVGPGVVTPSATAPATTGTASGPCTPTRQDVPANYVADAPVRSTIGSGGYRFSGTVRSATGCGPVADARVELWLANPSGQYDPEHRATLIADGSGRYTVNTSFPASYGGPAHIHIRVTARGHRALVSVFFPVAGTTSGEMDLILEAN